MVLKGLKSDNKYKLKIIKGIISRVTRTARPIISSLFVDGVRIKA